MDRLELERSRDWVPFNQKPQTCKLCLPRVWDGDSSWGCGNLNLGRFNEMGQQLVHPQPDYISPKPGEIDPVGFIAIFLDKSLGVENRGPDFQEGTQGSWV
jgi:hypothetical protein